MNVGFLILNYNSWELSESLARKVARYQIIDKVVIVDNCSSDDSFENLQKINESNIDVIKSQKNGGYAYGNNYGAQYCKEKGVDILFISNPDVDVEEKDVNLIVNAFEGTEYSILSGVEFDINKKMSQPPIWKQMTYKDDLLDCFYIGRKLCIAKKGVQLDRSQQIQTVELVKGSFLCVRLYDFLEVGGFDEQTFLFCEERILGRRMEKQNKKIGVVTAAQYFHNHSVSINKAYKGKAKQIRLLYNSRYYYHKKIMHIGIIQSIILKVSMYFSIQEYRVMDALKSRGYRSK